MTRKYIILFIIFKAVLCFELQASCAKGVDEFGRVIENEMDGVVVAGQIDGKGAQAIHEASQNAGTTLGSEGKSLTLADSNPNTDTLSHLASESKTVNVAETDAVILASETKTAELDLIGVVGSEAKLKEKVKYVSMDQAVSRSQVRNAPMVKEFKGAYSKSNLEFDNRTFIAGIDEIPRGKKPVYFDVENSVLKQLNDEIMETKDLSDATGNLFNRILYDKIQKSPELSGKLEGRYRDFKSLRFRFLIDEGEDSKEILNSLRKVYLESADEFEKSLAATGLGPLWEGRSGQLGDPKKWFLAGAGETPLEANMAARQARGMLKEPGSTSKLVEYESRIDNLASDIKGVEKIRLELQGTKSLTKARIMVKGAGRKKILSKDAIGILRKTKSNDFDSTEKYHAALNSQFKKLFGTEVDPKDLDKMTTYFESVDSLAPPLFVRNRAGIDLGQSENGLVSVDFTGVGVDNAYQAMVGLAKNTTSGNHKTMVSKSLEAVDEYVEKVTESMNKAKRTFNAGTKKVTHARKPAVFSGDDGIYFPDSSWNLKDKEKLVRNLGRKDPAKYRVTFVETKYPDGTSIPVSNRSEYIVRAEKIEKEIRKMVTGVGVDKISPEDAKKLMIAIDFKPSQTTKGEWGVLLGGKVNKEQKRIIDLALEKALSGL